VTGQTGEDLVAMMEPDRPVVRLQQIVVWPVRILDRALFVATTALFVTLIVVLFLQVLFRYVVEAPLPWSEEGARFILVWLSMLGACMAAREGQHFLFRWFTLYLPGEARFWLRRACDLLTIVVLGLILKYSLFYLGVVAHQTAPGTGLNMRVPYAGVSVGIGLLLYIYIAETVDCLLSKVTGRLMSRREATEAEIADLFMSGPERAKR
jgi:TRAP-type C4-dicarboxylate transport system permease small subunit